AWASSTTEAVLRRLGTYNFEFGTPPDDVAETDLGRLRSACEAPEGTVLQRVCSGTRCTWVLGTHGEHEDKGCLAVTDGDAIRHWSLEALWGADAEKVCTVDARGGPYGSGGDQACYSLREPGRMAFVDPAGLVVSSGSGYPVRIASAVAPAQRG